MARARYWGIASLVFSVDSRRRRAIASGSLVVATVLGLAIGRTYTDWGHLTAAVIGLILGLLFTSRTPAPSRPQPEP